VQISGIEVKHDYSWFIIFALLFLKDAKTEFRIAIIKMHSASIERLIVLRNNRMIGLITRTGLLRFLEVKPALELERWLLRYSFQCFALERSRNRLRLSPHLQGNIRISRRQSPGPGSDKGNDSGVRRPCHLLQGSARENAFAFGTDRVAAGVACFIFHLDQKPVLLFPAHLAVDQCVPTPKLFSLQPYFNVSFAERSGHRYWLSFLIFLEVSIRSCIPNDDRAAAILILRDHAFEISVSPGMVFYGDGEPLFVRIRGRSFWNRPRFQYTIHFQAKIVMQMTGIVLLNYEDGIPILLNFAR